MEYITLIKQESYGSHGCFGIKIQIAAPDMPDMDNYEKTKEIMSSAYKASEDIEAAVRRQILKKDPKAAIATINNRNMIDQTFGNTPIFVEEIPNGYCKDWCCEHLPWFIVTTKVGRIKIGWRKNVIQIEWDDTIGTKEAPELFPDEDVTKGYKYIHAWSIKKAKEYVDTIMENLKDD